MAPREDIQTYLGVAGVTAATPPQSDKETIHKFISLKYCCMLHASTTPFYSFKVGQY